MQETELEMAERHVREGAAHVARQKELLGQLRRDGHDTTQAEELLTVFEATLEEHRDDLERIRAEQGT